MSKEEVITELEALGAEKIDRRKGEEALREQLDALRLERAASTAPAIPAAPDTATMPASPPMGPRLSVAVMAHPKRRQLAEDLQAALDGCPIIWDEHDNEWDTGRRALLAYDPDATHHLVIQDDAVTPRDLIPGIENAIAHVGPDLPLSLYLGQGQPHRNWINHHVAQTTDATSWLTMPALLWGVAVVLPVKVIDDMIAWCDEHPEITAYDKRLSAWIEAQELRVWYTWPSLVDHRGGRSLLPGNRDVNRRAHRFLGTDRSALNATFDGSILTVPTMTGSPTAGRSGTRTWRNIHDGRLRRTSVGSVLDQHYAAGENWIEMDE